MLRQLTSSVFAITLAVAAPAAAQIAAGAADSTQTQAPKPKPPAPAQARPGPPRDPVGFRAYANFDYVSMAAEDSFDAVLGTSAMSGWGGGGEVLRIWKGLFGRIGVSSMSDEGSRVAIVNGQVIPLDIPIEISLRTLEIGAGWRHEIRTRPRVPPKPPAAKPAPAPARPPARPARPRFAVYGGAAFLQVAYRELSSFAETGETGRASLTGFSVFGGMDVSIWKYVMAGVEAQYRSIDKALGEGGVSEVYGETNLGGAAVRFMFGVRR